MRQGFRPLLVPPLHRRATTVTKQPILCLTLTFAAALLVIAIFGLSAWNVYQHRFGSNKHTFHSGDEVAVSEVASDFSDTFCDGYKVSFQGTGQAYLLPFHAGVNTTFFDDTSVDLHQLPYREFNVIYMYLLRRSSVNVTACRNNAPVSPNAEIVFIQGHDNFKKWRQNSFCIDCVLKRTRISDHAFCDSTSRPLPRLYHEVDDDNTYFLVIFNGRPGPKRHFMYNGIFLRGVVSRTHFDLSNAEQICHIVNSSSCFFDLPWMSAKDIVVKFERPFSDNNRNALTTHCQVRVIFWICLFGILPLVCIVLTIVFLRCFLHRTANNVKIRRNYVEENNGERTRLLGNQDEQLRNQFHQNNGDEQMAIQYG